MLTKKAKKDFISRLQSDVDKHSDDPEGLHERMDGFLIETLERLGYDLDVYKDAQKDIFWYS